MEPCVAMVAEREACLACVQHENAPGHFLLHLVQEEVRKLQDKIKTMQEEKAQSVFILRTILTDFRSG
jgi:predicted lysophospholipase L1 biosynthesis ABC-type transport system permease subunit